MQTLLIGQDGEIVTPGMPGGSETTGAPGSAPAGANAPPPGGGNFIFMMLLPLLLFMFVMTFMSGRKEKKRRQELMDSLQKHARVQTSGGVIGSIVEIRDNEVVLRVEEGRIRFSKSAIQSVLQDSVTRKDEPDSDEPESDVS